MGAAPDETPLPDDALRSLGAARDEQAMPSRISVSRGICLISQAVRQLEPCLALQAAVAVTLCQRAPWRRIRERRPRPSWMRPASREKERRRWRRPAASLYRRGPGPTDPISCSWP